VTETVTGRTRTLDPVTRAASYVDAIEWPIEIDVTVSESVVANTDDGTGQVTSHWYQTPLLAYTGNYGGFRFQTINIAQGTTLTSATLTLNRTGGGGATASTMKGQAIDDAPSWADTSLFSPNTMAQTTASTSLPIVTNGQHTFDVTAICQEIISRAGWVANNNLRIGVTAVPATRGGGYQYFEDYGAAGTLEPELEIIYTAAGGSVIPVFTRQYRQRVS